jgi:hypothetical protein
MGTLGANTSHFELIKMARSFVATPNMTKISKLSSMLTKSEMWA